MTGARIEGGRKPRKPIARSTKPIKRTPIKKKARKASETVRIYGTKARQEWMRAQPCHFCSVEGHTQICHAKTGGKSRKDDAERTLPMCGPHWIYSRLDADGYCQPAAMLSFGCHASSHRSKDLLIIAAEYQAKWLAHSSANAKGPET